MIILPGPTDKCSRYERCPARLEAEVIAPFSFLTLGGSPHVLPTEAHTYCSKPHHRIYLRFKGPSARLEIDHAQNRARLISTRMYPSRSSSNQEA
ncbi:hypothetical protein PGTUg99_006522 [Puccinia graminis f. sp. tritici]|uniref:Uncharacterized protein n=1 Tax=Puccinia graminis f. sp. tritici TaxID=56615 RepID=A0A5B0RHF8_PUCGR|nr:hypothetical protein PGTUg99_006522 [Puccinia graminis f. sp. tritici]